MTTLSDGSLRAALDTREVTVEQIRYYCQTELMVAVGTVAQDPNTFIDQEALSAFWWLHDYWAPVGRKPITLPLPSIVQFLWGFNYPKDAEPVTFMKSVKNYYTKIVEHCTANQWDIEDPAASELLMRDHAESTAKERMKVVREYKKLSRNEMEVLDDGSKEKVQALEKKVKTLRDEAAAMDLQLADSVKHFQQLMYEESFKRKKTAQEYKAEVRKVRTEIRALSKKQ